MSFTIGDLMDDAAKAAQAPGFKVGDKVRSKVGRWGGDVLAVSTDGELVNVRYEGGGGAVYRPQQLVLVEEPKAQAPDLRLGLTKGQMASEALGPYAGLKADEPRKFKKGDRVRISHLFGGGGHGTVVGYNAGYAQPYVVQRDGEDTTFGCEEGAILPSCLPADQKPKATCAEIRKELWTTLGEPPPESPAKHLAPGVYAVDASHPIFQKHYDEIHALDTSLARKHAQCDPLDDGGRFYTKQLPRALFRTDPEVISFVNVVAECTREADGQRWGMAADKAWDRREPTGARERSEERAQALWEELK